ncbi:GNAT family N-acetyltransferase [Kitasatospora sp. NPDC058965]|uniref:GNAT family N-acetyltransferase n=1 Tax=Kitasatospora sp. NPDC058965 TaxID=3346682 RepID=UPI0036AD17FB
MSSDAPERARALWSTLAGARFPAVGAEVVVRPDSGLGPPGWCGIVRLGEGALLTAPTSAAAERLRAAAVGPAVLDLTAAATLVARLGGADLIGPAHLAYLDPAEFRPADRPAALLPEDHPALVALRARATPAEADETGLENLTFAALAPDGRALAAAGYETWRGVAAHLNVFADPAHRHRGHARTAASAAVAHALAAGLLPQWRARPEASRRLAAALGFREYGAQLGLRLG